MRIDLCKQPMIAVMAAVVMALSSCSGMLGSDSKNDGNDSGISVTGVSLNKSNTVLPEGGTERLSATIEPAGADNRTLIWTSDDESVAIVSSEGLIGGLDTGSATITVTTQDGGFSDECVVTVQSAVPPVLDAEIPVITGFTLSGRDFTSIPVIQFSLEGTDDTGITAWAVTETVTPPDAGDPAWGSDKPSEHTLYDVSEGYHTLFAWARDEAGNVSEPVDCIIVDLALPSADLADLDLLHYDFDPVFSPDTLDYSLELSLGELNVTVTPEAVDPDATITVNGTPCGSGNDFGPVTLNLGENDFDVTVTASDGEEQTYSLEVVRGLRQAYIKESNTEANDQFGYSIALYGDTLAVGAYHEDSAATGINGDQAGNGAEDSGAVYVFVRSGKDWVQQAYIKASNADAGDEFGYSVALYGETLVVGAISESSVATGINGDQSDNSVTSGGAVYVFTRSGATWTQQAYIKASNTGQGDWFGYSVSLYGDTLAVGAMQEWSSATGINGNQNNDSAMNSGAVYVFTRSGSTWTQQAYIKASNTGNMDRFGNAVSLYGNTLAVGAWEEGSSATGINGNQTNNNSLFSGAVYVFTRSGAAWSQQAYIKASNTRNSANFGYSVSLYEDTLAVGSRGESSDATGINGNQTSYNAQYSGAVYVFTRSGATWSQQAYIKASNTGIHDLFGCSVSLSGDLLAVGANQESSDAVSVNADQANDDALRSGAAYVFSRSGTTWSQQAYVKASYTGAEDRFGYSVALYDETLACSAVNEDGSATGVGGNQWDDNAADSGAVYVYYDLIDDLW